MKALQKDEQALIHKALQMEKQFAKDGYMGSHGEPELTVIRGKIPIVISSPHAVNHPREGRLKLADTFTGSLALQLASLTNAHVIVYSHTAQEDPNYDNDGPYKQQIISLVEETHSRFVLDLHGIRQSRVEDIAIGTALGKTLGQQTEILNILLHLLRNSDFSNILVNDPHRFNAVRSTTITSFVWRKLNVPALQLEIHKKYRDAKNEPENYIKIVCTLRDVIFAVLEVI